MASFYVISEIYPTEDAEKVRISVINLFPETNIIIRKGRLEGEIKDIQHLMNMVIEQKIRYAFLESIHRHSDIASFSISLNKQAAFAGKVNLVDEPKPLGEIVFRGEVREPVIYFEKMLGIQGYISAREQTTSATHNGGQARSHL
ncbi:MAG: hypothetical protein KIY12_01930 [Thermoplasmata archaeon]|uniref:Uncharacterized protein n=1 Tax=Candidatus Sysuiplasma superficiale TaxID=2823368 RepID=A0A8J7YRX8_9ARCH|nr:hypothetical protein [Candidatus Sysuiplasma superficiale]